MSAAATARRSGMTLAEVLVALLLFGILASFVVGVVNSVLNLWQAGERRGRGDLVFAAAAERLRADVLAAHTGPRGWMQLDEWQAEPEGGGHPAWRLPRLRFLADGAAFPEADASGRGAVEVAWLLVPEPDPTTRCTRLVRIVQPESAPRSLREEGWITDLARAGAGLVVLDGVLHASFGVLRAVRLPARDRVRGRAGQWRPAPQAAGARRSAHRRRRQPRPARRRALRDAGARVDRP
jgi:prepilin-type N-terminal cleavage/methylation domain-containing protein